MENKGFSWILPPKNGFWFFWFFGGFFLFLFLFLFFSKNVAVSCKTDGNLGRNVLEEFLCSIFLTAKDIFYCSLS